MAGASSHGQGGRIVAMEGLRGYAVALVFLVHFVAHYILRTRGIDLDRMDIRHATSVVDALARWAWASHYGVDLFFLLSGFLIFRLAAQPQFRFGPFLWQRLQRLYPAFAIALVLHVLYQAVFWAQHHDWRTLAQNALFLSGIFELGIPAVIVPSWSLSFEWIFYLTTPPMLLLLSGRGGTPGARHAAIAGLVTLVLLLPVAPHYARFAMFFAGALLAAMPAERLSRWLNAAPLVLILATYLATTTFFAFDQNYYHFSGPYAFACALLVGKAALCDGPLRRCFSWAPLRVLGNVSYSFYLLHGLVVIAVVDHAGPRLQAWPPAAHFMALFVLSLALSVIVALASYQLLERPYFARRTADGAKLARRPRPGTAEALEPRSGR